MPPIGTAELLLILSAVGVIVGVIALLRVLVGKR